MGRGPPIIRIEFTLGCTRRQILIRDGGRDLLGFIVF